MLRRVALVGTDVSEEINTSFIRVKRIGELGTSLAVTSNRRKLLVFLRSGRRLLVTASVVPSSPILVTLMKEALRNVGSYMSHTALTFQKTVFFRKNIFLLAGIEPSSLLNLLKKKKT
jgi:hypothetical protein